MIIRQSESSQFYGFQLSFSQQGIVLSIGLPKFIIAKRIKISSPSWRALKLGIAREHHILNGKPSVADPMGFLIGTQTKWLLGWKAIERIHAVSAIGSLNE